MFLVTFYMPRMWYNRRGLHLRRGGHKGRPQPPHPLQQNAFFLTIPPTVVNCKVKVNLCALQMMDWGGKQVSAWIRTAYFYTAVYVWFEEELLVGLGPEGHVGHRYRRTTVLICLSLGSPLKLCTLKMAIHLCSVLSSALEYWWFVYHFVTNFQFNFKELIGMSIYCGTLLAWQCCQSKALHCIVLHKIKKNKIKK